MTHMRILIADDHAPTLDTLSRVLTEEGYCVAVAHDGVEACAVARSFSPQIVISDISMPHLDGFGVCCNLRRGPSKAPTVFLCTSGEISTSVRLQASEAGVAHVFAKPVSIGELLTRIECAAGTGQTATSAE